MELYELRQMQNLTLDQKLRKTELRIKEFYDKFDGEVFLSFSGGFNSTVLKNIIKNMGYNIPSVFANTGLEYTEILNFVKNQDNVIIVTPKNNFKWVIENKGYPIFSKKISRFLRDIQGYERGTSDNFLTYNLRLTGENEFGFDCPSQVLPKKYLKFKDASFNFSEECCQYIKKNPLIEYSKETNKKPITGQMAEESSMREKTYLKTGCNSYIVGKEMSNPVGFWLQQDMFKYAIENKLEYCKIYGDIIEDNGKYKFTGEQRTGCTFCLFGIQFDKEPNRIQRLKSIDKKKYDFIINELKYKEVLEYLKIPYE